MITFICSPVNWDANHLPYHYLYLGSYLNKKGIKYNILDYHPNIYYQTLKNIKNKKNMVDVVEEKILNYLKEHKPPYIGIAFYTSDYNINIELCKKIKQIYSPIIIAGNVHASIKYDDIIYENSPVDFVIRGEGEETLYELLNGNNKKEIDGIVYYDKEIIINKNRELIDITNLNPMNAYKKIDMKYYTRPTTSIIRNLLLRGVGIYTGRGCPFNCTFCCANMLWKIHGNKFIRYRDIKNVVDEISYLKDNYAIDGFYILDETFTTDKKRVIEFCNLLIDKNINLIWACETRANLVDKELLSIMKYAGCIQIEFGVETGSEKCLNEINKCVKLEDVRNAFKLTHELKMRTFANMLINIPNETEEDLYLNKKLLKEIKPTETAHCIVTPYPGTQMYEKYVWPKLKKSEYPLLISEGRGRGGNRFRMCKHDLNLDDTLKKITKKNRKWYQLSFISFSLNSQYLYILLKSKYLLQYVYYFFMLFINNILGKIKRMAI